MDDVIFSAVVIGCAVVGLVVWWLVSAYVYAWFAEWPKIHPILWALGLILLPPLWILVAMLGTGWVVARFAARPQYEGQRKDGVFHGQGRLSNLEGAFEGEFKDGEYHRGRLSTPGGTYEGEFKENQFHGRGKLTVADGTVYEGDYRRGEMDGHGRITHPDGTVYEGVFQGGVAAGQGKVWLPDGTVYEGEFFDDQINGSGTMTWPDGRVCVGEFVNGQCHGMGRLVMPDGSTLVGRFDRGHFVEPHVHVYYPELPDGAKYDELIGYTTNQGERCPICSSALDEESAIVVETEEGFGVTCGRCYQGSWAPQEAPQAHQASGASAPAHHALCPSCGGDGLRGQSLCRDCDGTGLAAN